MTDPISGARLTRRSFFGAAAATLGTAAVMGAAGSVVSPERGLRGASRRLPPGPGEALPEARDGQRCRLPLVVAARPRRPGRDRARGRPGRRRRLRLPRGRRRDPQPPRPQHRHRRRCPRMGHRAVGGRRQGRPGPRRGAERADRHHGRTVVAGRGPDDHPGRRRRLHRAGARTGAGPRRDDVRRRAARARRRGRVRRDPLDAGDGAGAPDHRLRPRPQQRHHQHPARPDLVDGPDRLSSTAST